MFKRAFQKKLRELDYGPDKFGLHSLRAGGATAVVNNGAPDCLFKRHGHWKSDSAKHGYILSETEINSLIADRVVTAVHFLYLLYVSFFINL